MKKLRARREEFSHSLSHSAWWSELSNACLTHSPDDRGCWLVRLRESLSQTPHRGLVAAIEDALAGGFTLRRSVTHLPWEIQVEWFGERLLWMRSQDARASHRWTSLVSSRLGRYGHKSPDWPTWLRSACQQIASQEQVLLWVPGTTVAALLEPVLTKLSVPLVGIQLPHKLKQVSNNGIEVIDWLARLLVDPAQLLAAGGSINIPPADDQARSDLAAQGNLVWLSPQLTRESERYQSTPLQDRIAIGWANYVYVLAVRQGGHVAHLLEQRLADKRWPSSRVAIRLSHQATARLSSKRTSRDTACKTLNSSMHDVNSWLARGAVGWHIPLTAENALYRQCPAHPKQAWHEDLAGRSHQAAARWSAAQAVIQPTWPAALVSDVGPPAKWPRMLVHCVRGSAGKLLPSMAHERFASAWRLGWWHDETPLENLMHIITSGSLRASSRWNRTAEACVSFSAVPLLELISRRQYQTHLGRWDWEPYGLLIDRQWLKSQGARPVIYGDETLYRHLRPGLRPYYQPAERRLAGRYGHWVQEREWRCVGDVRLTEIPRGKVQLFVYSAAEATALARHVPWPVIWLMPREYALQPMSLAHRRYEAIQTSRN